MATHLGHRQSYRQSTNTNHLNKKLRAVSTAEEESNRRNQEFLRTLTKVSKQAASLNEKTEKLKKVKHDYEDYISRLYPQWCEYMETVKESPRSKTSPNHREVNREERPSPPKFIQPQFDDERDMYPEFLQSKMERWRHDESLDLTPEHHNRSLSPPRRSPDNSRHSRNKTRSSPNGHRHSTNSHHLSPVNSRHSIKNRHHSSSHSRDVPNISRHSPNTSRIPTRDHETSFDMYHDGFYSRPKPFLPANELNERMRATYRSPQDYRNPGTYSGLFLPVSHEFGSEKRNEKMDDFENRKNIDFEKKGFLNESLLNGSMNFGTDLTNVTILPQLLGINGDGQLVLVPLASSFSPNGSFNNTFNELAAKHRFSPVGRNSDSPVHTINVNETTTLDQTFQANPVQISTPMNDKSNKPANKQRQNKGKQDPPSPSSKQGSPSSKHDSPSLSSKQEEEKKSPEQERQRQLKERQKERDEEKLKQEEKRQQELEEQRIRKEEELKRKEEQRQQELREKELQRRQEQQLQLEQEREKQRREQQRQQEIEENEQQRQLEDQRQEQQRQLEIQRQEQQRQLEIQQQRQREAEEEEEHKRQLEIQRQEQQRQFELHREEQQRQFELEREKQQQELELQRQEQQRKLDLELKEQRRKMEEEDRERERLRELEQERQREIEEQEMLKELQEQENLSLKQQEQHDNVKQKQQQNLQETLSQPKESPSHSKGKSLFSKLKCLGKSSSKKHQVKEETFKQQDSRQTFQEGEIPLNHEEPYNDSQSPGTPITNVKLSPKKAANNGSPEEKTSSPAALPTSEKKSDRSKDSMFSYFSEHSEFELPSNADEPHSSSNLPRSPSPPLKGNIEDEIVGSHDQDIASDLHPLMFIMERLTEKVKDEESEEVLALNIDVDVNKANTILGNAELEGNLDQFSSSELCMSFRYQAEQMLRKRDVPFIIHPIDKDSDFEGNLRDCINPVFIELWDSLFMFLSETMSAFEFDPVQVATIFAHVLIPTNKKQRDQFQSSLGKILASFAEETESESDEDEEDGGNGYGNTTISMTEEITTKTPVSKSEYTSPPDKQSSTDKGDLSKTLSFDKDDDDSSTVSFDSDGLPVRRLKNQDNTSDSPPQNNDSISEASSALNISGSKAYQEMYRESLMSPVHEDIDDDEGLEDLLGESIGLKKNDKPRSSPSSILSPLSKSGESVASQDSTSKKINLKKPGFWDSESDSDLDLDNTGKSGQQVKSKADDDNDFDFDFFE